MPNRDQVMHKILLSSICQDRKSQNANDDKREQPGRCYELQAQLSKEQQNAGRRMMEMQTIAHPPVERLSTNTECQRQNRFAREMYMKYPFMLPPVKAQKQEMADEQVGMTTYRIQYRDPNEVILELERGKLVRTSMVEWKPDCTPIRLPDREYRLGSKINFSQNEWGSRKMAAEKQAEEDANLQKKVQKCHPWTSEYRANIESMARFITDNDIFKKEKILVKKVCTLPD